MFEVRQLSIEKSQMPIPAWNNRFKELKRWCKCVFKIKSKFEGDTSHFWSSFKRVTLWIWDKISIDMILDYTGRLCLKYINMHMLLSKTEGYFHYSGALLRVTWVVKKLRYEHSLSYWNWAIILNLAMSFDNLDIPLNVHLGKLLFLNCISVRLWHIYATGKIERS